MLRAGFRQLRAYLRDEQGSVLGENALWIVLIVVVAAAALSPLGQKIKAVFDRFAASLG